MAVIQALALLKPGASGGNSTLTEFHVSGAKKLTVTTAIDFAEPFGALTTGTIMLLKVLAVLFLLQQQMRMLYLLCLRK